MYVHIFFIHSYVEGHLGSFSVLAVVNRASVNIGMKDGEALYSHQKEDWELTMAEIMNSLLPNSNFN